MRVYEFVRTSETTGDKHIMYTIAESGDNVIERERRDGCSLEVRDVTDEVFHAGDSSRIVYAMNMWNEAYPENKFSKEVMQALCGFILWNFKV